MGTKVYKNEKSDARLVALVQAIFRAADPHTAIHQDRVANICHAVSRELGLTPECCRMVYCAGMVHDLGKAAIPSSILSKPTSLGSEEVSLIRTHVAHGVAILEEVGFGAEAIRAVACHHERLDGSGYPAGLRGDDIPLAARIVTVADVFEAMTAHRPYRPGLGLDAALDELRAGSGARYDGRVVAALERCLEKPGDVLGILGAPK